VAVLLVAYLLVETVAILYLVPLLLPEVAVLAEMIQVKRQDKTVVQEVAEDHEVQLGLHTQEGRETRRLLAPLKVTMVAQVLEVALPLVAEVAVGLLKPVQMVVI
jgi:hypothetical protein